MKMIKVRTSNKRIDCRNKKADGYVPDPEIIKQVNDYANKFEKKVTK